MSYLSRVGPGEGSGERKQGPVGMVLLHRERVVRRLGVYQDLAVRRSVFFLLPSCRPLRGCLDSRVGAFLSLLN